MLSVFDDASNLQIPLLRAHRHVVIPLIVAGEATEHPTVMLGAPIVVEVLEPRGRPSTRAYPPLLSPRSPRGACRGVCQASSPASTNCTSSRVVRSCSSSSPLFPLSDRVGPFKPTASSSTPHVLIDPSHASRKHPPVRLGTEPLLLL